MIIVKSAANDCVVVFAHLMFVTLSTCHEFIRLKISLILFNMARASNLGKEKNIKRLITNSTCVTRHRDTLLYKMINFHLDDGAERVFADLTASDRLDLSFAPNKIIPIEIYTTIN